MWTMGASEVSLAMKLHMVLMIKEDSTMLMAASSTGGFLKLKCNSWKEQNVLFINMAIM